MNMLKQKRDKWLRKVNNRTAVLRDEEAVAMGADDVPF